MIDFPRPAAREAEYEVSEVQALLEEHEAVSLRDLALMLRLDSVVTRGLLEGWVQAGHVEELRPLGERGHLREDWIFFRWKNCRDAACLWQRDYFEGCGNRVRSKLPAQLGT